MSVTIEIKPLVSGALHDFRRTWPALLTTDILYKVLAFVLLTPLVGLALRLFVSTSGSTVLADTDILFFVLSPIGLVTLIVIGAVSLTIIVLEQACLMTIGLGAVHDKRIPYSEALRYGARYAVPVLDLTLRIAVKALVIAAPFLLAGGLVYLSFLTDFDINYYLTERPPAFWTAALLIAGILLVLAAVLVPRLIGWAFALPLLLFEGVPARQVLSMSQERVTGHRWTITLVLVGWALASFLLSGLVVGAVGLVGRLIVPTVAGSMVLLVLVMGGVLLLWNGANLVLSLVAASAFALLVIRLYEDLAGAQEKSLTWQGTDPLGERREWKVSMKALVAGLVVAAVVAGLVGAFFVDTIRLDADVVVIAHRGAAGAAPENTLASVERAIIDGADLVEIDVQETADGEVVVIHDSDLMRIGGMDLAIWDATYEQLQGIDVGSWFAPEFADERVPSLEQVLELCKGRAHVDIELKYYGHDERLDERVVEIVERTGMESEIVVMSLKYDAIQKVRKLRPDWTIGLLTAKAVGNLTRLEADFLAVHAGLATPRFIKSAHAREKDVFVWTVNDPVQMATMVGRGVDGIITDEPALARAVLEQLGEMNVVERLMLEFSLWFGVVPKQAPPETDA
ncbi:MAG: glycerophosphodiester phosphodiesterase [Vicinamibacteria bacterium]